MPEFKIKLDRAYDLMLQSLKPLAESVMEEELDFDTCVNVVIWRGR